MALAHGIIIYTLKISITLGINSLWSLRRIVARDTFSHSEFYFQYRFSVSISAPFTLSDPPPIRNLLMASNSNRADFEAVFLTLGQDVLDFAKQYNLPSEMLEWLEKVN